MEEYKKFWTNFFNFSGRSTRKDYWLVVLINMVVSGILTAVIPTVGMIYGLLSFIPGLSIVFRRLHDTNRSAGWIFISLVPLIGFIILIVFLASPSVDEGNKYGEIAQ